MPRRTPVVVLSLVLALIAVSAARAHGSLGDARATDLAAMAEQANLVVVADIAALEHRNTPIKGEQGTIPTTLVTLKIARVLRGAAPQGPLVLRFIGGPDGRGGVLGASGVPMFVAGETNVLFIKANGDLVCPLTNCEWGRFRVHEGRVYDTHGAPVLAVKKGHVVAHGRPPQALTVFRFPAPSFDAVMQNDFVKERLRQMGLSPEAARARYEKEAPKFIEYALRNPPGESPEPVDDPLPAAGQGAQQGQPAIKTPGGPLGPKSAPPGVKAAEALRKALPKAPMTLDGFVAALTPIAKGAKRPATPVASANLAATYVLPPIGKSAPSPSKPTRAAPDPAALKEAADPLRSGQNN